MAILALVLVISARSFAKVAAAGCDGDSPAAGPVIEAPETVPALVAPVSVVWKYPPIESIDKIAWSTGSSIAFQPPENYTAGFDLVGDPHTPPERYELLRFEISQVQRETLHRFTSSALDVALVHRQTNAAAGAAPRYALVSVTLVPLSFAARTSVSDVLRPISARASLPRQKGKKYGHWLLTDPQSHFFPELLFENATFLHSWGPADGVCGSGAKLMRRFVRQSPQPTPPLELKRWVSALHGGTPQEPLPKPPFAWMMQGCPRGSSCPALNATETSATLTDAVARMRQVQSLVQDNTAALEKHPGHLTGIAGFEKERLVNATKAALAELTGARGTVERLSAAMRELARGWDADAPPRAPAA